MFNILRYKENPTTVEHYLAINNKIIKDTKVLASAQKVFSDIFNLSAKLATIGLCTSIFQPFALPFTLVAFSVVVVSLLIFQKLEKSEISLRQTRHKLYQDATFLNLSKLNLGNKSSSEDILEANKALNKFNERMNRLPQVICNLIYQYEDESKKIDVLANEDINNLKKFNIDTMLTNENLSKFEKSQIIITFVNEQSNEIKIRCMQERANLHRIFITNCVDQYAYPTYLQAQNQLNTNESELLSKEEYAEVMLEKIAYLKRTKTIMTFEALIKNPLQINRNQISLSSSLFL